MYPDLGPHCLYSNGIAKMLNKLHTSKGDYWIKQWFSSIGSLFKMGTSLKGKNLLPEGAKNLLPEGANLSFMSSSLWYGKITFTTLAWLGDLP